VNKEVDQNEWYKRYYQGVGAVRNDLRSNPEVLFQILASEASVVRALRDIRHVPATARVLDVGCGGNVVELTIPMHIVQAGMNPATTPFLASANVGEEFISSSRA
jgi:hypothetical protein